MKCKTFKIPLADEAGNFEEISLINFSKQSLCRNQAALKQSLEDNMSQEQLKVNYDQFYFKPVKERIKIFNTISAENRAFLVKNQAERWLAANCSRLTHEQESVVEEFIQAISPEWYKTRPDFSEEIDPKVEKLLNKVKTVLPREDVLQLATKRADYIPIVKNENN